MLATTNSILLQHLRQVLVLVRSFSHFPAKTITEEG